MLLSIYFEQKLILPLFIGRLFRISVIFLFPFECTSIYWWCKMNYENAKTTMNTIILQQENVFCLCEHMVPVPVQCMHAEKNCVHDRCKTNLTCLNINADGEYKYLSIKTANVLLAVSAEQWNGMSSITLLYNVHMWWLQPHIKLWTIYRYLYHEIYSIILRGWKIGVFFVYNRQCNNH